MSCSLQGLAFSVLAAHKALGWPLSPEVLISLSIFDFGQEPLPTGIMNAGMDLGCTCTPLFEDYGHPGPRSCIQIESEGHCPVCPGPLETGNFCRSKQFITKRLVLSGTISLSLVSTKGARAHFQLRVWRTPATHMTLSGPKDAWLSLQPQGQLHWCCLSPI